MPDRIVVGVDGSAEATAAADWAAREARRRGLAVHLVHAWGWHPQLPAPLDVAAKSRAEHIVDRDCGAVRARYPTLAVTAEMTNEPADAALLARARNAAMLVLGSRGHSAVSGFLLGSVGHQVLARARCPVAMVRANDDRGSGLTGTDIVVGLRDMDRRAQPLLRFAFSAADRRDAALRVVHAWNLPSDAFDDAETARHVDDDGALAALEEQALVDAVRPWQREFPRLRVLQQVVPGSAARALAGAASCAALIVVGRTLHRPALAMPIGPVTHGVLHHAAAPVVVVPHD